MKVIVTCVCSVIVSAGSILVGILWLSKGLPDHHHHLVNDSVPAVVTADPGYQELDLAMPDHHVPQSDGLEIGTKEKVDGVVSGGETASDAGHKDAGHQQVISAAAFTAGSIISAIPPIVVKLFPVSFNFNFLSFHFIIVFYFI